VIACTPELRYKQRCPHVPLGWHATLFTALLDQLRGGMTNGKRAASLRHREKHLKDLLEICRCNRDQENSQAAKGIL
jgi:hypothetical protein